MAKKLKRWSISGSAQINFSVEVNCATKQAAADRVDEMDLQDILDNGVVTVDELEVNEPEVVTVQ